MRDDVRALQDRLLETELLCVPSGTRDTTEEVYPAVKSAYPDLCDDDYLCSEVCDGGTDQPEWMHATRRVQQQLKRKENSRVERRDGSWFYNFPALYLQPVSDEWIDRFARTVRSEVTEGWATVPEELEHELPTRIWGIEETDSPAHQSYIDRMCPGDLVLYYHDGDFIASGRVKRTIESDVIGDWLWNNPQSKWVYLVTEYDDWGPDIGEVWSLLGYGDRQIVTGFMRVSDIVTEELRREYGSIESAILWRPREVEKTSETVLEQLGTESPKRRSTVQDQVQRDQRLVEELKCLYDHRCQICETRLQQSSNKGYSEVHHLQPLGSPHDGPDVSENMIVLCPNHHADFDNGMVRIEPDSLQITHEYDTEISGHSLSVHSDHEVGEVYLQYHNSEIAR
ncbi:HNH endonuclease [Salinigranum salinum]|uniref:HNH endonuclease n=1 Tax=Salinigranum salinum TaxID=1364937 RepID=UPI0012612ADB|nr:HNH endonuclease [Salinigranum salinum]